MEYVKVEKCLKSVMEFFDGKLIDGDGKTGNYNKVMIYSRARVCVHDWIDTYFLNLFELHLWFVERVSDESGLLFCVSFS